MSPVENQCRQSRTTRPSSLQSLCCGIVVAFWIVWINQAAVGIRLGVNIIGIVDESNAVLFAANEVVKLIESIQIRIGVRQGSSYQQVYW